MKVDLHIHTCRSRDCLMSFESIIRAAKQRGLGAIAITDHNTIAGALEMARRAPFLVIVGEEIKSAQGEIIGLFLREEIPAGMSARDTAEAIHNQGGIVYIPHPLDRLRQGPLDRNALYDILDRVHVLEVFNARVTFAADNEYARRLAEQLGIPGGAGSDAHVPYEVGRAYVEMPTFSDPASFLQAIARGRVQGTLSWPWVHAASSWAKGYKRWSTPVRIRSFAL